MDAFIDKGKGVKQQTLNALVKNREPAIESICRFLYGAFVDFYMDMHCLLFWLKVHYLLLWL